MVLQAAGLCLLLLLAVAIRMVGADVVLSGGEAHLVDPDSHLHAWRMERALESFPALPPFTEDHIAYPDGAVIPWPPGLDYLGGALAWLAGLHAGTEEVARLGTLLVVMLGALCVVLAARLAWRYVRLRWALVAGTLLALAPFHVEHSRVGRIDPHAVAPLVILLAALLYFRAVASGRRWRGQAVACGVALGAALWLWPTALLPVGLLGLGMALHGALAPLPPAAPLALGVGLLVTAPLCLAAPYRGSFVLHAPSAAHLAVLGTLLLASLWGWLGRRRIHRPASLAIGVVATLTLLVPTLTAPLQREAALADESVPWRLLHPLYELSTGGMLQTFGLLIAALPLLVGLALAAPLPSRRRHEVQLLALWSGLFLLLGFFEINHLPLALALSAPLWGIGLSEASRRLVGRLRGRARPPLLRAVGPALALGTLSLQWPTSDYLVDANNRHRPQSSRAVEEAARRIRTRPAAKDPATLATLSAGGVLLHLGRTPVVGAALVTPGIAPANHDAVAALTLPDMDVVEPLIHRRRVGRVLVGPFPTPRYAAYLRFLGKPTDRATVFRTHRRTLAVRLYHDLGSGAPLDGDFLPAVSWLQHTWESIPRLDEEPAHLFRVVPGARLEGRAPPRSMVELRLPLVTNRGRPFEYRDRGRADSGGRFRFRLPYWSARTVPGEVIRYLARMEELRRRMAQGLPIVRPLRPLARPSFTPLGPLELRAGDRSATVDIPRSAVLVGQSVRVEL